MPDLAEFLLARIAEDELVAAEGGGDDWSVHDERKVAWHRGHAHGWVAFVDLPTATAHIARWDPARVLAECAAKRRIVEMYGPYRFSQTGDLGVLVGSGDETHWDVLRLLALPYADHPEYDQSWRP